VVSLDGLVKRRERQGFRNSEPSPAVPRRLGARDEPDLPSQGSSAKTRPGVGLETWFWLIALGSYALIWSFSFWGPVTLAFPNKDVWQHLAALSALIADPIHPINPFVGTQEGCRLYGPVDVVAGFMGHGLGLSALQIYALIAAFNLFLLAIGQYVFGKAYFRSTAGPLALFIAMSAMWIVPFIHTGLNSIGSLIEGAAYPSTTGIAGSLLLWGLTIRLIERPKWSIPYAVLVAGLLDNHQLSAGIALIGSGLLIAFWPGARLDRLRLAVLTVAGLLLAAAWPYLSPYTIILTAGSPDYGPSINFYSLGVFVSMSAPAWLGVTSLKRPTAIMAAAYFLIYLTGLFGVSVAHRFLMPLVLVLQIGCADLLLALWSGGRRSAVVAILGTLAVTQLITGWMLVGVWAANWRLNGDLLSHSRALDLHGVVAAPGVAAWPLVASGVHVVATPLPEPLIHDQAQRQWDTARMFDPTTPLAIRRKLSQRYHVRSFVVDATLTPPRILTMLSCENRFVKQSGPLLRFDPS
jgi:hypothetical protein